MPAGPPLAATLAGCGITASPTNNKECANSLYAPGVATGNTYGRENSGAALTLDYNFWRDLTLTSITSIRHTLNEDFDVSANLAGEFGDTLPQNLLDRNLVPYWERTFSEELRVQSPASDRLNFVAGMYFSRLDSHDRFDQAGAFGLALPPGTEFHRQTENYIHSYNLAGFGQVNLRFNPQWQAFLGARVTHDHLSDFSINSFANAFPAGPFFYTGNTGFFSTFPISTCTLAGGNPDIAGSCPAGTSLNAPGLLDHTGVSARTGVQFQPNQDLMFFGTVARGYKGGFINEAASFPISSTQLVIEPEYALDFELGVKTTISDRFGVDLSLFHERFDNFQTTIYVPPSATQKVANFIQGNAPFAVSQGVDINFYGKPLHGLTVNGGILYNNAHFNDGFQVNCGTGPCRAVSQLPYASRWRGTLSGEYAQPVNTWLAGFVQSDLAYQSSFPYASAPGFPPAAPRYLIGARIGLRGANGNWDVAVFCRNCLDKRYPIAESPDGLAAFDGGAVGGNLATGQFLTIDSFRLFGVTLDARF